MLAETVVFCKMEKEIGRETIRQFWDFYRAQRKDIENFDTFLVHFFSPAFWGPHQKRVELLFHYSLPEPILEAGCGAGWLTFQMVRNGLKPIGTDLLEKQLEQATLFFDYFGLKGSWALSNLAALPFPDNTFSSIIAFDVLEHIKELDRTLAELGRVLKPGGFLYVTVPNGWGSYCLLEDRLHKRIHLPLRRFVKKTLLHSNTHYEKEGVESWHEHLHGISWWKRQFHSRGLEVLNQRNIEFLSTVLFPRIGYEKSGIWSQRDCRLADKLPAWMASEWFFQISKK